MSEGSPAIYNEGDIVWVKLGSSWWPGEVIDLKNLPKEMATFKKPPLVVVKFFDEDKFEYVRSWLNIYPYNSDKKSEFIKKGMASHRSKMVHMEKFPQDVATAELKSGGNPNILSDPAYMPEKKRNIVAELFGSPAPRVKKIKDKKNRVSKSSHKSHMSHITHRRFLGSDHLDDYRAYVCIQFPGKGRDPNDFEDKEVIRLNSEPEQEYNCQSCSFSTKSIEIMIFHTKSHLQGVYVSSTGKKLGPKKEKARIDELKPRKSKTIKKPKQKKSKATIPTKPQDKPKEIKKAADLPSELLAEWDDSEDEDMEAGPSGAPPNGSQDLSALDSTMDSSVMETSQESTINTTQDTSTDTSTELDETQNASSVENKSVDVGETKEDDTVKEKERSASADLFSDDDNAPAKLETSPQAKPKKVASRVKSSRLTDQSTQDAIKSCFDFEEEEEPPIVSTVISGRKIPRVIPLTERKKSNEMDEDDLNKEQILKESESFTKKLCEKDKDSQEIDIAFKELMETTKLPDLPDVQNTLKCEQNFHNIETIKFPDKPIDAGGSLPPKLKTDKSDSSEIATKLTNPKKRFVKSFEALRKQNEIEQKEECSTKKISAQSFEAFEKMQNEIRLKQEADKIINEYGEYPEPSPKKIKVNKDEDGIDEKITFAKLKTKIMSKIIEEANIHEESKNKIMNLMNTDRIQEEEKPRTRRSLGMHKSPRSKILETYRNQNEMEQDKIEDEKEPEIKTKESYKEDDAIIESMPPKKKKWTRGRSHPKKDRKFLVEETEKDSTATDETVALKTVEDSTATDNSASLKTEKDLTATDNSISLEMEKNSPATGNSVSLKIEKDFTATDKSVSLETEKDSTATNNSISSAKTQKEDDTQPIMDEDKIDLGNTVAEMVPSPGDTNLVVANDSNVGDHTSKVYEKTSYNDDRSQTPLMDEPPFVEDQLSNDDNSHQRENDTEKTPQLSKILHENNQSEEIFGTTSYSYSFTTGMDDFSSLGHASPALPENAICLPPKKSKKRKLSKSLDHSSSSTPEKSTLIEPQSEKKKKKHEKFDLNSSLLSKKDEILQSSEKKIDSDYIESENEVDSTVIKQTKSDDKVIVEPISLNVEITDTSIDKPTAELTEIDINKESDQMVEELPENIILPQTEEVIEETVVTEQLLDVDQHEKVVVSQGNSEENVVFNQETLQEPTEGKTKSSESVNEQVTDIIDAAVDVAGHHETIKEKFDSTEETEKSCQKDTSEADVSSVELKVPLVQDINDGAIVTDQAEYYSTSEGTSDSTLGYSQLESAIQQTETPLKDVESYQPVDGMESVEEASAELEIQPKISEEIEIVAENLVQEETVRSHDAVSLDKSIVSEASVKEDNIGDEEKMPQIEETMPQIEETMPQIEETMPHIEEKTCEFTESENAANLPIQNENSDKLIVNDTLDVQNIIDVIEPEEKQSTSEVIEEEIINEPVFPEEQDANVSSNEETPEETSSESNVTDKVCTDIDKDNIEQIENSNSEDSQPNKSENRSNSSIDNDLKYAIEPNLTHFSSKEEVSVMAMTTLGEMKSDSDSNTSEDVVKAKTMAESLYTSLPESELVPIEGNLTVVSEKDLADGQVEITPKQVISSKKPVMLSNFSMDFSESTILNDELESKGTEFTSGAITKELKLAKKSAKKPNTYERLELLDILEGNSDQDQKKLKERKAVSKSFVADDAICDFEEHIPSQIVCAETLRREKEDVLKEKVKDKEKDKVYKNMITSTTSKLLERLSEGKPKDVVKPVEANKGLIKVARSKTVDSTKFVNKPKKMMEDIEDVQAFVIPKDMKKADGEPDTENVVKPPASVVKLTKPKAKILQQTIITPAGEIIQPSEGVTHQTDDNIFDINSMPIVLSDEIFTPESIEKMPIVIGSDATTTKSMTHEKVLISTAGGKPVLKKFTSEVATSSTVLVNQTAVIKPSTSTAKITRVPKILQKQQTVIPGISKPGKYIIVPQSAGLPAAKFAAKKTTLIRRPHNTSGILSKLPTTTSESTGNKIMVVTNQQGQQQRLLLTPAQQKMLGYPGAKVTKTIVKSNVIPKTVLSSESMPSKTSTVIGQKVIIGTSSSTNLGLSSPHHVNTPMRSVKTVTKKFQPLTQQKIASPKQKTILITTKQGQTLRKIHGTEEDLEKQVAEQLEAIRASSGAKFGGQPKVSETFTLNKASSKSPRRSYSKKPEIKQKTGPPPLAEIQSPRTEIRKTETSQPAAEIKQPVVATETKVKPDRPLNQLVIQDALGNQTTITEGQILALPSETVDGQPQSYMLVTLDESGNLTPLNNEALMSLDPNLGLGGDLSNMVLHIDQSALTGNTVEQQRLPLTQSATVKPNEPIKVETAPSVPQVAATTEIITENIVQHKQQQQQPPDESLHNMSAEPQPVVATSSNGDAGQQLIVTGDPIATQKFFESLTEGTTDLANLLANAEGNSILIQADGQQILINTNADNQMMLSVNSDNINSSENTEGGGNPIFATQPTKNQDILAAALADTDVFQSDQHTQNKIVSQLSPNNALYPMNVGNVLETSLTLSSPIMTPLEVPSTNNKKIPDDETDILTQVPKNVDLPITITDPNISQTVANQQVASMIANELQANLELNLPISETTISTVSSDMNSPSYSYSLPTLDDTVVDITHKPFSSSMPLLTEEAEEQSKSTKKDDDSTVVGENHKEEIMRDNEDSDSVDSKKPEDSINSDGSFLDDEGRFTLGGEMCSSLSEPPPEMFDLPEIVRYGR